MAGSGGDLDGDHRPPPPKAPLRPGSYLGDVSALSFVPSFSRLLLAGTGSELLVYAVETGRLLASFRVFDGVRIHGIAPRGTPKNSKILPLDEGFDVSVAVFGERRVKLFVLRVKLENGEVGRVVLDLEQNLPGFDHWVLDACFLEMDGLLTIGLSDNSVALWDLSKCALVARVKSPEKCLLYSMRMWGSSVKGLLVASGTIFNEILIWKLVPQVFLSSSSCSNEMGAPIVANHENVRFADQQHMAINQGRLRGHEGSIFRIAWSSDGSKFMSVSDDRSARIWMLSGQSQDFVNPDAKRSIDIIPKLTLFGHNARIWDCYISDTIIITAGEDCTCCVWGMDGSLIKMFKEHIGRGIWRCLYDPSSSLLITAGFDSAIKVRQLTYSSLDETVETNMVSNDLKHDSEAFTISSCKVSEQIGLMDSKSEYVRCLHFVQENVLYIATNNGYLHHAEVSNVEDVIWTEVVQVHDKSPIICMDAISMCSDFSLHREDIIALGDGRGNVTIVRLINGISKPKVDLSFTWPAEKDRQLLGVYWCKSLECSYLFTADPRGVLKLWNVRDPLLSNARDITTAQRAPLVAVFESCFGARIMCIDASAKEEILVAGDKRGNITVFPFPESLVAHDCSEIQEKIPLCDRFKGAHGISSVTSISIVTANTDHIEIRSTGGDSCICFFNYGRNVQNMEFVGMKQVKELGTIQSVFTNLNSEDLLLGTYAVGFTSADFIIWDLINETKMVQISCGGWRRPYSYYLGTIPEFQNCFAFLKDHNIHVHRLWLPVQEKSFPQILHMQYHGREVHSLCFIDSECYSNPEKSSDRWIATGCEDGTVRLTRYSPINSGRWCASKLLGEHVGGSAVSAICFIPKMYTFRYKCCSYKSQGSYPDNISAENKDNPFLLISVGSKQVLTSWILQNGMADYREERSRGLDVDLKQNSESSGSGVSAMSFQWLSTHMPPKLTGNRSKAEHARESSEEGNSSIVQPNPAILDQMENDWRYLSVTAFLLKHTDTELTVCFIVVACSDATVMLRALLLPSRLWFDIALLAPQTSPVLALQHIIVSGNAHCKDGVYNGDRYIAISGSTDGSITFWDLTDSIEHFMQLVSEVQPQLLIDCRRRPKTGRGSQGGRRRWRSLINHSSKKKTMEAPTLDGSGFAPNIPVAAETSSEALDVQKSDAMSNQNAMLSSTQSHDIPEVRPMHVLTGVHQSGVNCLHVSEMKNYLHLTSRKPYCIVSGGDDQAVHCLGFTFGPIVGRTTATTRKSSDFSLQYCSHLCSDSNDKLKILHQHRIPSAHSSAVKGIWTDGVWTFSTGLDQRIRCWKLDSSGKLIEYSHVIISVPEPETLDAVVHDREKKTYQIAVAGRGMQMVEFSSPEHEG